MEVHVLCEDVWLTWWHEESIRRMELEKGRFFPSSVLSWKRFIDAAMQGTGEGAAYGQALVQG